MDTEKRNWARAMREIAPLMTEPNDARIEDCQRCNSTGKVGNDDCEICQGCGVRADLIHTYLMPKEQRYDVARRFMRAFNAKLREYEQEVTV